MNYQDYYSFPAVLEVDHEDNDVVNVSFPDLETCFSNGDTLEEALINAKEALENVLYWCEKDGIEIPRPTDMKAIKTSGDEMVTLVVADMKQARRLWDERSVNRTVTLPAWLDELARIKNVNSSQLLQKALKNLLGVKTNPKLA